MQSSAKPGERPRGFDSRPSTPIKEAGMGTDGFAELVEDVAGHAGDTGDVGHGVVDGVRDCVLGECVRLNRDVLLLQHCKHKPAVSYPAPRLHKVVCIMGPA
jgi:hypothetical protein